MGAAGRRLIEREHTLDRYVDTLVDLLVRATGGPRAEQPPRRRPGAALP
jgi:hypothetical protein